jgi:hypothetical protein
MYNSVLNRRIKNSPINNPFFLIFSEILRAIDSLQLTENKKVATPADWKVRVISINHTYLLILCELHVL